MDVENIDALNPAELDALLERALDPRVPVEVFYAVLERIGPHEPWAEAAPPQAAADSVGQARPVRSVQPVPNPPAVTQSAHGSQSTALPPPPQPLSVSLPSQGSPTSAQSGHQQQASPGQGTGVGTVMGTGTGTGAGTGTGTAHQQSNAPSGASPQQAPIGRRAAQHGPPPRGFVVPVSDTEATTVMRAVTGVDGPTRANPAAPAAAAPPPSPDTAVSPTAQTTLMPAVPPAETDERPEKPSR